MCVKVTLSYGQRRCFILNHLVVDNKENTEMVVKRPTIGEFVFYDMGFINPF